LSSGDIFSKVTSASFPFFFDLCVARCLIMFAAADEKFAKSDKPVTNQGCEPKYLRSWHGIRSAP
jgi:hypothetical protein